jgi:hypothetical protein
MKASIKANTETKKTYLVSEAQYRLLRLLEASAEVGRNVVIRNSKSATGWVLLTPKS